MEVFHNQSLNLKVKENLDQEQFFKLTAGLLQFETVIIVCDKSTSINLLNQENARNYLLNK